MNTNGYEGAEQRLGVTFHRTFPLVRAALIQVLDLASRTISGDSRCMDRDAIRELTHLGKIYVEAMPRYGYGAGLLDDNNCLSRFGTYAQTHDRYLEFPATQWLMHYHLSAPHGPGPTFWHNIVARRFRTGAEFTRDDLAEQIATSFTETEGKPLAERSAQSTATIFLGTYTKDEGLNRLRILEEIGPNRYRVGEPDPPPDWAFGYALLDFWRAQFGAGQITTDVDRLSGPGGLTELFLIGAGRMHMMLRTLMGAGYVDVHRVAPPYQVVLLRQDPEPLLQRLYGIDDSR